jgi:hypothetical protein
MDSSLYTLDFDLLCVRFDVIAAMSMKSAIFWEVTLCNPLVIHHFEGIYRFHLHVAFLLVFPFDPE